MIFVFGSNLAGIHGAGAAKVAHKLHGAVLGVGVGRQGNSYALPTRDEHIRSLPLDRVAAYVDQFIRYARAHSDMEFQVTCVGCGLAGFREGQIAPMFRDAPDNCLFDLAWDPWLPDRRFWGTF